MLTDASSVRSKSNTRLERTSHERASLLSWVGEPLKRNAAEPQPKVGPIVSALPLDVRRWLCLAVARAVDWALPMVRALPPRALFDHYVGESCPRILLSKRDNGNVEAVLKFRHDTVSDKGTARTWGLAQLRERATARQSHRLTSGGKAETE